MTDGSMPNQPPVTAPTAAVEIPHEERHHRQRDPVAAIADTQPEEHDEERSQERCGVSLPVAGSAVECRDEFKRLDRSAVVEVDRDVLTLLRVAAQDLDLRSDLVEPGADRLFVPAPNPTLYKERLLRGTKPLFRDLLRERLSTLVENNEDRAVLARKLGGLRLQLLDLRAKSVRLFQQNGRRLLRCPRGAGQVRPSGIVSFQYRGDGWFRALKEEHRQICGCSGFGYFYQIHFVRRLSEVRRELRDIRRLDRHERNGDKPRVRELLDAGLYVDPVRQLRHQRLLAAYVRLGAAHGALQRDDLLIPVLEVEAIERGCKLRGLKHDTRVEDRVECLLLFGDVGFEEILEVLELAQSRLQVALTLAARLLVGTGFQLDGRLRDVERAFLSKSGNYLVLGAFVGQDLDLPHPAYSHPMLPPGCGCSGRDDFEDLRDAGLDPLCGTGAHAFDARPALGHQLLRLDLGFFRRRCP
jgi:hypothetical protein